MLRVELSAAAVADVQTLVRTHSLPPDTPARLTRAVELLSRFPNLGHPLPGRWDGARAILGPWRWMVVVYLVIESEDRVIVVTVQDGRSGFGPPP